MSCSIDDDEVVEQRAHVAEPTQGPGWGCASVSYRVMPMSDDCVWCNIILMPPSVPHMASVYMRMCPSLSELARSHGALSAFVDWL